MFGYMYTNEMDKDEIIKQLQDEVMLPSLV